MTRGNAARAWWMAVAAVAAMLVAPAGAHKGLVSAFTYADHAFPILRDRCGACHYEGGPAPMSLLTYESAAPWAEAIREQLLSERMPPGYVDPTGPAVRGRSSISPRELDILLTWAAGGAPPGRAADTAPRIRRPASWTLGPPDLIIPLAPYVLPEGQMEYVREVALDTGLRRDAWVKAVDVRPGLPAALREAAVESETGGVLTVWGPGEEPVRAPSGTGFHLGSDSRLRIRMTYRRDARLARARIEDRSQVGLYLAHGEAGADAAIQSLDLSRDGSSLSASTPRPIQVLAVRTTLGRSYAAVSVDAVLPGGRRRLLALRATRVDWPRRYWLAEPAELPAGARIEAMLVPADDPTRQASHSGRNAQLSIDFIQP